MPPPPDGHAAGGPWYRHLPHAHWIVLVVAALGPLTSPVFAARPGPMRYAGITMCVVFLVGLATLPFAPETHGQPLPE